MIGVGGEGRIKNRGLGEGPLPTPRRWELGNEADPWPDSSNNTMQCCWTECRPVMSMIYCADEASGGGGRTLLYFDAWSVQRSSPNRAWLSWYSFFFVRYCLSPGVRVPRNGRRPGQTFR